MGLLKQLSVYIGVCVLAVNFIAAPATIAAEPQDSGFSIEVNPSPLVETLKPGEKKTLELRIRNNNTIQEQLKLELRSFKVDNDNGSVTLTNETPSDIAEWVKFSQPAFSVKSGEWTAQHIVVNTPESAGFTYYFAIVISRQNPKPITDAKAAIEGSVAVFTLLNIDRPGAVNKLEIEDLTSKQRIYEYLPATFTLKLKNTGNTLVRPAGNIYIQRSSSSADPAAVLALNPNGSYLLPGVTRLFSVEWKDGFPAYVTKQEAANIEPKQRLEWNWGKSKVRIGRYVAHVVAVYNDGQRDVPVKAEIGFWVLPWKIITGLILALAVLAVGVIAIAKYALRVTKRKRRLH